MTDEAAVAEDTMIKTALAYAKLGLRPIPLKPGEKVPALPKWPQRATDDPKDVRAQFQEAGELFAGNLNVGLAMGNGFLAVDVDMKDGKDGLTAFRALVPDGEQIPPTWISITPTGGRHAIFKTPPGFEARNSTSALAPGVDIKFEGGQIVAPGSVTGAGVYGWKEGYSPSDIPCADMPSWLLGLLRASPSKKRQELVPVVELDGDRATNLARQWLQDQAPRAVQGQGGRDVTKQVIQTLFDLGLSPDGAYNLLTEENGWDQLKASPPWASSEEEAEKLHDMCGGLWSRREHPPGYLLPLDGSEFDAVSLGKSTPLNSKKKTKRMIRESFAEASQAAVTDKTVSLVRGLLDCDTISTLYGLPDAGKSFVAIEISRCVAMGAPFAGRATIRGAVAYFCLEGKAGLKKRLRAVRMYKADGADLPLYLFTSRINLFRDGTDESAFVDEVRCIEEETGLPVLLIVIDTLAKAAAGADENSVKDMGIVMDRMEAIKNATRANVMFIHHAGKVTDRGLRGSSAVLAATDTVMFVKADTKGSNAAQTGSIKTERQKDGERIAEIKFRLVRKEIWNDPETLEAITSCIVEFPTGRQSAADVLTETLQKTLSAMNAAAKDTGGVVKRKQWLAAVRAQAEGDGDVPPKDGTIDANISALVKAGAVERCARGKFKKAAA